MRLLLGALYVLALIIIAYYSFKTYRHKHRLAVTVNRILQVGLLVVGLHLIAIIANARLVILICYSLYFAVSDWLLYYLLKFSLEYIGGRFEDYVKKPVMISLLFLDNLSALLNIVFNHIFDVKEITLFGQTGYYGLIISPFFYVHYAIIGMLAVLCLITLFYKSVTAPVFYRKKYFTIAIIVIILVGLNICTVRLAFDCSVFGYMVAGVAIYYCSFVYTPQRLLQKTFLLVAQDLQVGLLVTDVDGNRMYINTYAQKLLDGDTPIADEQGVALEQWCLDKCRASSEEFSIEKIFFREDEELMLKIQLQQMTDAKKQLQGCYFMLQDCTEEMNNLKKEQYRSTHDALTGLYNKLHFYEKVESYLKRHEEEELLMICTDIKDFKMINDCTGTRTGDEVLVRLADMIRAQMPEALLYGRLENDHFGILMAKKDFDESRIVEWTMKAFVGEMKENVSLPVFVYVGVYEIVEKNINASIMCDRARMAISNIKGDYHKRVAYYDNALRERIRREQELNSELGLAIKEEQLQMFLQPQTSADGKLLGAEALIRWKHPKKGYMMPKEFIPVFEKNGLISEVDKYVWEVACRQLKKWKEAGWGDLYISVNISLKDFYFLNIYQVFTDLVNKYDIEPKNLKLEITETAVVMDLKRQMDLITRLRQTGFVVEMDDFGSGYSSLNMLKDIHVDILKIDMAFLKKARDEERSKKILQMIISLSTQLGMPVITEGIESAEQVAFLKEMGCDMFQGYYFGKPMEVSEFEEMYLK